MQLSIRQLEIVRTVAECRSVSAAARSLRISQPAVTRHLHDIERGHDVVLFERTARGVVPTPFGEALLRRAHAIGAELDGVPADFESLRGMVAGRLAIGISPAAPALVPRVALRLQAEFPGIHLVLQEDTRRNLFPALRAGELDVVVAPVFDEGAGEGLIDEVLLYNRLSIIARWRHPLANRQSIPAAELTKYDWIVPPSNLPPRLQLDTAFHQARIKPPRMMVTTGSFKFLRELLLDSNCLSVLVRDHIRPDQTQKLLRTLPGQLVLPLRPLSIVLRSMTAQTRTTVRFVQLLKEAMQDSPDRTEP